MSRESTSESAAILCRAACVSDVIKKAGMCGRSAKYVTNEVFVSTLVKKEPTWLLPEELRLEAKLKRNN